MDESKHPHPVDIAVGARLRQARLSKGMSQGALAEKVGVTFQQIQKYENGSNRISSSKLVEIADILLVPPATFFEGLGAVKFQPADLSAPCGESAALLARYESLPLSMQRAVLQLAVTLSEAPELRTRSKVA